MAGELNYEDKVLRLLRGTSEQHSETTGQETSRREHQVERADAQSSQENAPHGGD